jgi:hypothetical protein
LQLFWSSWETISWILEIAFRLVALSQTTSPDSQFRIGLTTIKMASLAGYAHMDIMGYPFVVGQMTLAAVSGLLAAMFEAGGLGMTNRASNMGVG